MSELEYDKDGLAAFVAVRDSMADRWLEGTNTVLKERNPVLLAELTRLESVIDSLIQIPKKPKSLQKQFREMIDRYAIISNDCIAYASRHIKS